MEGNDNKVEVATTENNDKTEDTKVHDVTGTTEDNGTQVTGQQEETLEAKKTRLERQLKQVNKKLGVSDEQPAKQSIKSDLSPMDIYALMDAKVPKEDISEVVTLAKAYGVDVSEALKLDSVKATLAYKSETRKTAQATATGSSRRSSNKVSDEVILENASKGRLPQTDDDIEALVAARDKARSSRK